MSERNKKNNLKIVVWVINAAKTATAFWPQPDRIDELKDAVEEEQQSRHKRG